MNFFTLLFNLKKIALKQKNILCTIILKLQEFYLFIAAVRRHFVLNTNILIQEEKS